MFKRFDRMAKQFTRIGKEIVIAVKSGGPNPDDNPGWLMLARSYSVLGRHADALKAYEKASNLRKDDATLLADYADSLAVNNNSDLTGEPMLAHRAMAQGGGAIVNTASQWGLHPAPNHIAYNVSKAAVASFTQNLGRDYAPHRIRVNAVCPGEIHTPMLEAGVTRSGRTIADLDRMVPFGRIGKPEEVAALVAFLASEEAPFMCGSLVEITGGKVFDARKTPLYAVFKDIRAYQ